MAFCLLFVDVICVMDQNAVTGEHTCMVLKPLHSDDIEVDKSDQCGFLGPFYRGELVFYVRRVFFLQCIGIVLTLIGIYLDFKQRFSRLLGSSFRSMEYKLAMRLVNKINSLRIN